MSALEYSKSISDGFLFKKNRPRLAALPRFRSRPRFADFCVAPSIPVRVLSGLLPICAWCKKVRDDKDAWQQLEAYIHDPSEAEFTHCICPACASKLVN